MNLNPSSTSFAAKPTGNPGSGLELLYYDGARLAAYQELPGMKRFLEYFRAYRDPTISPVDRSGVLIFPVRMRSLFPLPRMRVFTDSFEDVCNQRAQELLVRAEKLDTSLYVFWSGGIDSTCVLISLLKMATTVQKERIVVLMSEDSIFEYSGFYRDHIRGKLRRESAMLFSYILGTKNLIVNGECNDQLFGSDIISLVINRFGADVIHEPYSRDLFRTFFTEKMADDWETAWRYVWLFERLCDSAPITLSSNYDHFWWINFAMKWQTVFMRVLSFVAERNAKLITKPYVEKYYAPFFNSESFQLWSMNNPRARVKDGWRSYKWPAKEVIYNFTKDADYRDTKLKRGSLHFLRAGHAPAQFIDDRFKFYKELAPERFYEPANVFV
jgi:hypothetical protein